MVSTYGFRVIMQPDVGTMLALVELLYGTPIVELEQYGLDLETINVLEDHLKAVYLGDVLFVEPARVIALQNMGQQRYDWLVNSIMALIEAKAKEQQQ